MIFQNYVYVVQGKYNCLGVYPNFERAYKRIESIYKNAVAIIDKGDRCDDEHIFEIVRKGHRGYIFEEYKIERTLLTIYPEDKLVSIDTINEIEQNNKARMQKYKCITDTL